MTFACPKSRKHLVQLTDRACPVCGFRVDVWSLTTYYVRRRAKRLMKWLRKVTALRCPACQMANPLNAITCGHCGTPITVRAVSQATMGPPSRGLQRAAKAVPERLKRFVMQAAYLALSVWLFHHYLMPTAITALSSLLISIPVSFFLVTVLLLLAKWLLPRTVLTWLAAGAPWMVKLAVLCNALTLVEVVVLNSGNWWLPSAILADLLAIVYGAALVITVLVWPVATNLGAVFKQGQGGTLDPSQPQGRTAHTI